MYRCLAIIIHADVKCQISFKPTTTEHAEKNPERVRSSNRNGNSFDPKIDSGCVWIKREENIVHALNFYCVTCRQRKENPQQTLGRQKNVKSIELSPTGVWFGNGKCECG
jgi:hypothetical protein